ncbi:MAG: hypothetical protein JWQ38_3418 [Flavipsychrobacter sp.]|nr:hypothetical protein [Flavipsychrobacter sp.]
MRKNLIARIIILSFLIITAGTSFAAVDSLGHKYPRVLLVQLFAEKNRLEALEKARKYKDIEEVTEDAKRTMEVTVNDFRDHFTYCPVYYFIDTNLEAIKNKQFDGVLLNADMSVVTNPTIKSTSTDYVIVYYGYPNAQKRSEPNTAGVIGENAGQRLVILNDKYRQMTYLSGGSFDGPDRRNKKVKYAYTSRHFDLKYLPFARRFSYLLQRHPSFKNGLQRKKKIR